MARPDQTEFLPLPASDMRFLTDESVGLLDVLGALGKRKTFLTIFTAVVTVLTTITVFLLPVSYTAEAVIMPPQQAQSALASLTVGALGAVAGGGVASQLGLKNQNDLYIGILKSRSTQENLIRQFHLQSLYKEPTLTDTRAALERHVKIETGKDTLIHIAVEDHDPKRAADLANAHVDELYQQNSKLALTEASQRRLFFERQLANEKTALANAEVALKQNQEATGLVMPAGQGEALIRSSAQLRAELASREVQLQTLRSYATDQNPQIQLIQQQIATLHDQIKNLETASGREGMQVSASQLPAAGLDYVRKTRDVKYHEALMEFLAKQYEAAWIDESKSAPVIQVIDRAVEPDKRSWPPRALLIAGAALLSLFIASVIVLTQSYLARRV
jgi:tyrosine-protein kinase Etk/Wzc